MAIHDRNEPPAQRRHIIAGPNNRKPARLQQGPKITLGQVGCACHNSLTQA
jgi:hypothetical protein